MADDADVSRWETIEREGDGTETSRLAVPGGWLYRVQQQFWGENGLRACAVALQFVSRARLIDCGGGADVDDPGSGLRAW